jgi:hypothetical protein
MKPHRTFKPEFKARVVMQLLSGTQSAAHLCREPSLPCYPNPAQDRVITRSDEVWAVDITCIKLRREFIYVPKADRIHLA